jgi:hypothetical protein
MNVATIPDSNGVLLDVIDRRRRVIQHGAIVTAIGLLVAARFVADTRGATAALAFVAIALALLAVAASVWQRWVIDYQGYRLVVENNPLRGERLLVGGKVAAKGRLGFISEMTTTIATSSGPEEILVRTEARLTWFRCVVRVIRSAAASASDAELLAEVRRRGLA